MLDNMLRLKPNKHPRAPTPKQKNTDKNPTPPKQPKKKEKGKSQHM